MGEHSGETLLCDCVVIGKPVSVNRVWRSGRGHTYKCKAALAFEAVAIPALLNSRRVAGYGGACALDIESHRRTRRRYDLDNCVKQIQDCVQRSGIIIDDSQIYDLHVCKRKGKRDYVRIRLYAIEEVDEDGEEDCFGV